MSAILTNKQQLALALSRKGLRDHAIAAVMGNKRREKVCRLRQRGLKVIRSSPAVLNGLVTEEQVLAMLAQKITIPTPSLELALAS